VTSFVDVLEVDDLVVVGVLLLVFDFLLGVDVPKQIAKVLVLVLIVLRISSSAYYPSNHAGLQKRKGIIFP